MTSLCAIKYKEDKSEVQYDVKGNQMKQLQEETNVSVYSPGKQEWFSNYIILASETGRKLLPFGEVNFCYINLYTPASYFIIYFSMSHI